MRGAGIGYSRRLEARNVLKMAIGLTLGFLIGAGCRWFDVPTPSPPTLLGACLVVSMTVGYLAVDSMLTGR